MYRLNLVSGMVLRYLTETDSQADMLLIKEEGKDTRFVCQSLSATCRIKGQVINTIGSLSPYL